MKSENSAVKRSETLLIQAKHMIDLKGNHKKLLKLLYVCPWRLICSPGQPRAPELNGI